MEEESLQGDDLEISEGVTLADALDADGEWDGLPTEDGDEDDGIVEEDGGGQAEPGEVIAENVAELDTTVRVNEGDRVIVTLVNGEPVVTGVVGGGDNMAGDVAEALDGASAAAAAAASAVESAAEAEAAAKSAKDTAEGVEAIAVEARETANGIAATAQRAADDAASASASAGSALASARSAAYGLADVEKVIDSLAWLEEHGSYLLTTDEAVRESATYYELVGGIYSPTADAAPDRYTQYYEHGYSYAPTDDEEPDEGKIYYALEEGEYSAVASPDAADMASYYERSDAYAPIPAAELDASRMSSYYERSGFARVAVAEPDDAGLGGYFELVVDESVRNYLASHLALTERGLELAGSGDGYRAVLTTDGLEIRDPGNRLVGLHGETVQLGSTDGIYFEASASRLAFRTLDEMIAYFGLDDDIWQMHISASYVDDMMRFGDYAFIRRKNGNLSLKWMG